ncbi:NAD-dependent epimerase/dehydratase family protein [Clostridium butyricum]|uniref:NAD-dependent epimerase/dehydratase family protein n=1 Tax=Clostridium butyricum TaxID=1492 RepID=UPI003467C4A2
MKTIIVTGATSFIGMHIINQYINNNYKVVAIVRPNSLNLNRLNKNDNLIIIEKDIDKINEIFKELHGVKVDVFYHLAWEGARIPHRDDPILQNKNFECSIKAMNVAKLLGCSIFIGAGSQSEYGKCMGKIDENYPTNPITEYGKMKLKSYKTLKNMAQKNKIKFIWTRIFSVYGIYDYQETLVMSVLNKMIKNENIQLTQCVQKWDFINVEDAAKIMYLLGSTNCKDGIYNIASGESRELKEFVIEMKKITKSNSELQFGALQYNKEGIINCEPIVEKLNKNLNYKSQVKFKDGIKKIIKFYYN